MEKHYELLAAKNTTLLQLAWYYINKYDGGSLDVVREFYPSVLSDMAALMHTTVKTAEYLSEELHRHKTDAARAERLMTQRVKYVGDIDEIRKLIVTQQSIHKEFNERCLEIESSRKVGALEDLVEGYAKEVELLKKQVQEYEFEEAQLKEYLQKLDQASDEKMQTYGFAEDRRENESRLTRVINLKKKVQDSITELNDLSKGVKAKIEKELASHYPKEEKEKKLSVNDPSKKQ